MKIHPIASGSSGNAIVVSDGVTSILLDAGISYRRLARRIDLYSVQGVLLSHHHGDHVKGAPELIRRGHDVYASLGEWEKIYEDSLSTWNCNICYHGNPFRIDSFLIMPFNVRHDTPEPLGFMIKSEETGKKLVYIVDSAIVDFSFNGITHWLLEANHYREGLENSDLDDIVKQRIANNHMSFENLQRFLSTSDMSKTEEIHLLHLSKGNSHEKLFQQTLQQQYGVPVYCH